MWIDPVFIHSSEHATDRVCSIAAPPRQRVIAQYISVRTFSGSCDYLSINSTVRIPRGAQGNSGDTIVVGPLTYYMEPESLATFLVSGVSAIKGVQVVLIGYSLNVTPPGIILGGK